MLSFLSWGQYFTFLAIALLLYYLFIAVVYYGNELQSVLKGKAVPAPAQRPASSVGPLSANVMGTIREQHGINKPYPSLPVREPEPATNGTNDHKKGHEASQADDAALLEEAEDLADHLKAMMERSGIRTSRAELMEKISKELKAYSAVVDISRFKASLSPFIQQQASELCDIELEDEDIDAIWKSLQS